uniref:Uncharacterized protein n=1 Tax=Arundo donax TaxID=35708 RepID=A0A0A8Y0R1_ARUDO
MTLCCLYFCLSFYFLSSPSLRCLVTVKLRPFISIINVVAFPPLYLYKVFISFFSFA